MLRLSIPKKQISLQNVFSIVASSLLVILFVYTGLNKLLDYNEFKFQIGRSPFLNGLSGLIAVTIPIGELIIAALLIFKRTRLIGFVLSYFLMTLFTGYIWMMLHYSHDLPCSCGGILAALSWNDHLVFNSVFTVLSLLGMLLEHRVHRAAY